jgi:hypothetical protein
MKMAQVSTGIAIIKVRLIGGFISGLHLPQRGAEFNRLITPPITP